MSVQPALVLDRLFTPGARLGWVFRDLRRLAAPFREPEPDPERTRERVAAQAAATQARYARARRWTVKPSLVIGLVLLLLDVSPTAVDAARRRFRCSTVEYVNVDLLSPPHSWANAFDLVVEVFTLQVLTGAARRTTFARIAQLVAPGGRLLVIAGARDEHDDPGTMPWPLTRAEIESFREHGLSEHSIADVLDEEEDRGLVRRWLAWFIRTEASRPARRGRGRR